MTYQKPRSRLVADRLGRTIIMRKLRTACMTIPIAAILAVTGLAGGTQKADCPRDQRRLLRRVHLSVELLGSRSG